MNNLLRFWGKARPHEDAGHPFHLLVCASELPKKWQALNIRFPLGRTQQ